MKASYTVVASLQAFRTFSVVFRVVFRNYSVILGVKNRNYSFFGVIRRLFGSWLDKYFFDADFGQIPLIFGADFGNYDIKSTVIRDALPVP